MRQKIEFGLFVLGLVAIVTGLAMYSRPAAFVGGGILLIALTLVSRKALV